MTVSVTTWVPGAAQPVAQRVRLLGGHERLAHGADHAHAVLLGAALEHAVEPVLLGERVDHRTAAAAGPADPPRARLRRHGVLGVDGLVRAVERAQAEVDDADLQVSRVHPRPRDLPEGLEAEPHRFIASSRASAGLASLTSSSWVGSISSMSTPLVSRE